MHHISATKVCNMLGSRHAIHTIVPICIDDPGGENTKNGLAIKEMNEAQHESSAHRSIIILV
jgi:hypothetical protein